MTSRHGLTDDQLKTRHEVAERLERALREARAKLAADGLDFDPTGGDFCFRCDCESWKPRTPPDINHCARPTCRHSFVQHNVL
ncbi:hypothetical protein GCM10020229_04800 [Kitasatospora albolonga]|uniref:hypothetical protein n=1 Tax=Kitasatospora albolonga TaxID=68173 RepID=UPI0031EC0394